MRYLILFSLLLVAGCYKEPDIVVSNIDDSAFRTLDDVCQDTDLQYQVILQNGPASGVMHCEKVERDLAKNCIGTKIRLRRDFVRFGSSLVFITKRQSCPSK